MQNLQVISTKELRDNLSEILERVAIGKESFLVSKFGKRKALIKPLEFSSALRKPKKAKFLSFAGALKDIDTEKMKREILKLRKTSARAIKNL